MGRSPTDRITSDIGREISQRDGIKAMLNGSIDSVGGQYVITLEATNASSGESRGRQQDQAERKEDVLNALHGAATKLRGQLGESLSTVQKYDVSLSQATTSSLDALKALSLGDAKHNSGDELGAVPNYQHAIEIDPNFAMAYARLGTIYNNLRQTQLSEQNQPNAFELRDLARGRHKWRAGVVSCARMVQRDRALAREGRGGCDRTPTRIAASAKIPHGPRGRTRASSTGAVLHAPGRVCAGAPAPAGSSRYGSAA